MRTYIMIKKTVLAASLLTLSLSTQAEGWEILPITNSDYQADFAIAAIGGKINSDDIDSSTKGVELSLNCPLLKAPNHTIRQQVSYLSTDKNGIKSKSFELSPHHMFNLENNLSVGIGPSLGVVKVETSDGDDTAFTYGAGVSARYDVSKNFFVGAEVRRVLTKDIEIGGTSDNFNSTKALIKVGYQF